MLGSQGGFFDYTASQVKVKLYADATDFCAKKGLEMVPLGSVGGDADIAKYSSAEIEFQCIGGAPR